MRDLEVVMNTRNSLKDELQKHQYLKDARYYGIRYNDLSELDKKKYGHIMGVILRLQNQINTLDFVLNEDSQLRDVTMTSATHPFTKEDLFNEKQCKCKCDCIECNVGLRFL